MSFITSAFGAQNGYQVQNAAGSGSSQYVGQDWNQEQALLGQQGTLAQQLLAQSQGQGPNVANLQLQQATNQNIQQGAGQIASQRGMNPALAQRLIAQNTAAVNQNAAGQSGILRAQQQLASQGALANVYGQEAGEAATNLSTNVGAAQSANQANAQIAQNNSNLNASTTSGFLNPASTLSLAKGGKVKEPHKHLEDLLISIGTKIHPQKLSMGGTAGAPPEDVAIFAPLAAGRGGASGGSQNPSTSMFSSDDPTSGMTNLTGPAQGGSVGGSAAGDAGFAGADVGAASDAAAAADIGVAADAGASEGIAGLAALAAAKGGEIKKVDAMVSPGERYIPPHLVEKVRTGKLKASQVAPKFPGKPKVKGDSEQNDIIPTKLAPGGVVIKRSKADNDADAREFLQEIAKEKAAKTGPSGYAKVLQKRRNAA